MTLTLSMAPGVAALRAEAVAYPHTIAPHGDFCHVNDPDQEHDFGLGDGSRQRVCQRERLLHPIPVRRTEHGRDKQPGSYSAARKIKSTPHCSASEATAKRVSIRRALTSVPFALPRWRSQAIALRHLVGNKSRLDVAVDQGVRAAASNPGQCHRLTRGVGVAVCDLETLGVIKQAQPIQRRVQRASIQSPAATFPIATAISAGDGAARGMIIPPPSGKE